MFKKESAPHLSETYYVRDADFSTTRINPGAKSKLKSSAQRGFRAKIVEQYPLLAPHIEEIIPKKSQLDSLKLYAPSPKKPLPKTQPQNLFWN